MARMNRSSRAALAALFALHLVTDPAIRAQALPEVQSVLTMSDGGTITVVIEANGALPMPTAGAVENPPRIYFDFAGVKPKRRGTETAPGYRHGAPDARGPQRHQRHPRRARPREDGGLSHRRGQERLAEGRLKIVIGSEPAAERRSRHSGAAAAGGKASPTRSSGEPAGCRGDPSAPATPVTTPAPAKAPAPPPAPVAPPTAPATAAADTADRGPRQPPVGHQSAARGLQPATCGLHAAARSLQRRRPRPGTTTGVPGRAGSCQAASCLHAVLLHAQAAFTGRRALSPAVVRRARATGGAAADRDLARCRRHRSAPKHCRPHSRNSRAFDGCWTGSSRRTRSRRRTSC